MITKGIVEQIIDATHIKVRMPFIDGISGNKQATPTDLLSDAIICALPNSNNIVNEGDIVFLGFENNDIGKPIILGHLFKESNTYIDLIIRKLEVNSSCYLPSETSIGDITSTQLKMLSGLSSNIQGQLDAITDRLSKLEGEQ